jgi:hypothetical protein
MAPLLSRASSCSRGAALVLGEVAAPDRAPGCEFLGARMGRRYEDILISKYASAVGGTFGHGFDPYPLARRGPNDLFSPTTVVPAPLASTESESEADS